MSLQAKVRKAMEKYVSDSVLPCAYEIAKRHGYDGDYNQFCAEVLNEMKGAANDD